MVPELDKIALLERPENSVHRTYEQNVSNFFRYCAVKSNAHYDMAELYRWRHHCLGIVVVSASAIVGTATFTSITAKSDPSTAHYDPSVWLQLATGLLSVAATVLSALQTFLGFANQQERHKRAGDGYSSARRELEFLVMKFPEAKGSDGEPATVAFESLKRMLNNLDKGSPTIPDAVYDAASSKTPAENCASRGSG
jgi:hypothetical protein